MKVWQKMVKGSNEQWRERKKGSEMKREIWPMGLLGLMYYSCILQFWLNKFSVLTDNPFPELDHNRECFLYYGRYSFFFESEANDNSRGIVSVY